MFYQAVFGSGILGMVIWFSLFGISTAALALAIRIAIALKKHLFVNEESRAKLFETEKGKEVFFLTESAKGSLFDEIAKYLIQNYFKDRSALEGIASDMIGRVARRVLRLIGALQMCANVAPMLGLLGTVQGMVAAFMGLGTAMGPEKASVLAVSISQALYTTAAGLVIAIPATILCICFRNKLEGIIDELNDDVSTLISHLPGDNK